MVTSIADSVALVKAICRLPGAADFIRATANLANQSGLPVAIEGADRAEIIKAVRTIVESVVIYPSDDVQGRDLILTGQLAALLQPERLRKGQRGMETMVAGTGFGRLHAETTVTLPVSLGG